MNCPYRCLAVARGAHTCILLGTSWVVAIAIDLHGATLGGTVELEKAISIVESLEKKFHVLRWKAHCVKAYLANAKDSASITTIKPGFQDSQVVFDPVGRRYHIEMQNVGEWIKGAAPSIGVVTGFSFDGEVYRSWKRSKPGSQLPTVDDSLPASGHISKDRKDLSIKEDLVGFSCIATGTGYMPPFFWDGGESPNQPLSRLLRKWLGEKRAVSIVENSDGVWSISTPITYAGEKGYLLRIGYDPSKGGVVTGVQWVFLGKGREVETTRLDIELQKVGDGLWAPKTIKRIACLDKPPHIVFASYHAVEVNPPIEPSTFQLAFPRGVEVTDHVKKTIYITGKVTDEPSAVRAYMVRFNLTGDVVPSTLSYTRRIVASVVSLIMVVCAILLYVLRKRRVAR